MNRVAILTVITIILSAGILIAGTTGKIAGTVTDAESGMPLPGVNVIVQGTMMGAATNLEGYFVILNVPPGVYSVKATMMGYTPITKTDARINIDLTTTIDFKLSTEVLAGEEVTIVAERPIVQTDVSASIANIQSDQIEAMPVQNISEVVGTQAGVLGMNIRGGAMSETAFMIDGFTLRDERTNKPYTAVSLSSIQDIQIQTGGFTAEYGNLRSGMINVVTKEGSRERFGGTMNVRLSPPAKKHFGPSAYDPMSYWNRPFLDDDVCWTGTENGAWDENTQKQYPRFEGWNAVSERTLQNDDPTDDLTPEAAQRVYKYQHRKQGDIKKPDFIIDGGFGGPVPFISKQLGGLRFYLSHRQEQNMYLIPLSIEGYNDNVTQIKFTSNLNQSMKLTVSGMYGEIHGVNNNNVGLPGYFSTISEIADEMGQRSYVTGIMYGNDYWCPTNIYRHMVSSKLTYTKSPATFYEFSLERVGNIYRTEPNAIRDTTKIVKIGNDYWLDEAPYGYMPYPSSGIDGLRMGVGMSNSRDYSEISTTTARANLTSQMNRTNQIKAGIEFIYNEHRVEYGGIDLTLPSGRPWTIWDKYPVRGAAYITDKMEFKGLKANIGIRLDYIHAGGEWYDLDDEAFWYNRDFFSSNYTADVEDEVTKSGTKHLYYFSPRLGISHPITDNSKLYFNYGHYRSMPEAERLYTLQRVTEGSVSRIGNPNNTPSRTIAYELGYEHNILNQFLLRLSTYYKDETNQPNWVRYISADSKVNYYMAHDNYYEDIRGLEVSLERLFGKWVYGMVNYTYRVSTSGYFGKLRYYENPAEQREYDRDNIYQEKPLPRPYFKANIIFHTPVDYGPKYMGNHILGDWLTSFRFIWREGSYSTWTRGVSLPGIKYNVQWPDYLNLDMRLSKNVKIGNTNLEFYMDINNLFNNKIFSRYCFSDGNDYRDYFDSLLWPKSIGEPLGYTEFGDDQIGDLRPSDVEYDALEPNPNNDPEIEARNSVRRETKSYIDNPNLKWLYYLNPRDIFIGIKINF
ncbi:hypothetical protein B6I21_07005 [candidate division KSB1 bacterium 4572_119]|nr:MAG: hypothetical protein B6I21_07005 [candidate division KSB1 bacterium 4572_119]